MPRTWPHSCTKFTDCDCCLGCLSQSREPRTSKSRSMLPQYGSNGRSCEACPRASCSILNGVPNVASRAGKQALGTSVSWQLNLSSDKRHGWIPANLLVINERLWRTSSWASARLHAQVRGNPSGMPLPSHGGAHEHIPMRSPRLAQPRPDVLQRPLTADPLDHPALVTPSPG